MIRLDQNTQPRPPAWYAGSAAWLAGVTVNRYPDSSYLRLREAISGYTGFPADQIVATAGADEGLEPARQTRDDGAAIVVQDRFGAVRN